MRKKTRGALIWRSTPRPLGTARTTSASVIRVIPLRVPLGIPKPIATKPRKNSVGVDPRKLLLKRGKVDRGAILKILGQQSLEGGRIQS